MILCYTVLVRKAEVTVMADRKNAAEHGRMRAAEVIRRYRQKAGLEAKALSLRLGFSACAVTNWERGVSRPDLDTIPRLCEALRMPVHELLGMPAENCLRGPERAHLDAYRSLSPDRRLIVDQLTESLCGQQQAARREHLRAAYRPCILYTEAAAAGVGTPMDGASDYDTVYVRRGPAAEKADFLIRVNGESMEPVYPDGCTVYVEETEALRPNETGVFVLNGESYIKQYGPNGLHSFNPEYPDIRVDEDSDCRIIGRVLGIVGEGDLPSGSELRDIEQAYAMTE